MPFALSDCGGAPLAQAACIARQVWRQAGACAETGDVWRELQPGVCGDCEDHTFTVGEALIASGVYQPSDLRLLLTRDGSGNAHAVLLLPGGMVADNGSVGTVRGYPRVWSIKWEYVRARVARGGI